MADLIEILNGELELKLFLYSAQAQMVLESHHQH